jgi:hypothetical protein
VDPRLGAKQIACSNRRTGDKLQTPAQPAGAPAFPLPLAMPEVSAREVVLILAGAAVDMAARIPRLVNWEHCPVDEL